MGRQRSLEKVFQRNLMLAKEIIGEFSRNNMPIIVSLFPQAYTNLSIETLGKGFYLLSTLFPKIVHSYLLMKIQDILESKGKSSDRISERGLTDILFVKFLITLFYNLDKYVAGAITYNSDLVKEIMDRPPEEIFLLLAVAMENAKKVDEDRKVKEDKEDATKQKARNTTIRRRRKRAKEGEANS